MNLGTFPANVPSVSSQVSFFQSNLPTIRYHLNEPTYGTFWNEILGSIPSTITLRTILTSLFVHLNEVEGLENSDLTRAQVKRESLLLRSFLGKLTTDRDDLWDAFNAVILNRDWDEGRARIFVCWVAGTEYKHTEVDGMSEFFFERTELTPTFCSLRAPPQQRR